MNYFEIFKKYDRQELVFGEKDCLLMILEYIESPYYKELKNRYKTIIGCKRLTEFKHVEDYLSTVCIKINPRLIQNGDLVVLDIHSGIFHSDLVLGVVPGKKFGLYRFDLNTDITVWRLKSNGSVSNSSCGN